jgi:signal transduction histidine kinase
MSDPAKYEFHDVVDVPDRFRARWRTALNTLADLLQVNAALVMRRHERQIEVFATSSGDGNVYEERERAQLDTGLYCERVMSQRSELAVSNALADPEWKHNPDIALGMVSYLGLPLVWPTGQVFGTICVLDNCPHEYSALNRATLEQFRELVQDELALVFENNVLKQKAVEREEVERELRETQSHLQSLARRLQVGRERERAMLARGLHDEIIQNLTAAKMDLDACVRKLPEGLSGAMNECAVAVDERLMATIRRVREMCENLVPAVLEDLGLAAAIDWAIADFSGRTGIVCEMRIAQDSLRVSPDAQYLLFRILQQALLHASAAPASRRLIVELVQHKRSVVLRVAEEGHPLGEPELRTSEQMGLGELEAQVASWGGKLRTWRTPDEVAFLEVTVPVVDDSAAR